MGEGCFGYCVEGFGVWGFGGHVFFSDCGVGLGWLRRFGEGTFVCWGEEGLRWKEEEVEEEGVGWDYCAVYYRHE